MQVNDTGEESASFLRRVAFGEVNLRDQLAEDVSRQKEALRLSVENSPVEMTRQLLGQLREHLRGLTEHASDWDGYFQLHAMTRCCIITIKEKN